MKQKPSPVEANPENTPTKTPTLEQAPSRARKFRRAIGTTALIGTEFVTLSLGTEMALIAHDAPNLSPTTLIEGSLRTYKHVYDKNQRQDLCPPAPKDLSILPNVDIWSFAPPRSRGDIIAFGEAKGLTFANSEALEKTSTEVAAAQTMDQVTHLVSDFSSAQLNIPITTKDLDDYPDAVPDLAAYKQSSLDLLDIMTLIPKSLLDKINISNITIAPLLAETKDTLGLFNPAFKSVTIDINHLSDPRTIFHEIVGHGTQNTVCHGYTNQDHAITDQNPAGYTYLGDAWDEQAHNVATSASDYAQASLDEDEAETTAGFILNSYPIQIGKAKTPLDKKTSVIIDRLDQLAPGSAEYLGLMGLYTRSPELRSPY